MPGERELIESGERLLQESDDLIRFAKMKQDQRADYEALIAEIHKHNSLSEEDLAVFLSRLKSTRNPWLTSHDDTQVLLNKKKDELEKFLLPLKNKSEQKDNQSFLLTSEIEDRIEKLRQCLGRVLILFCKKATAIIFQSSLQPCVIPRRSLSGTQRL